MDNSGPSLTLFEVAFFVVQPEGLAAISRWLSEAIPPEPVEKIVTHPEGMPATFPLASLRDATVFSLLSSGAPAATTG